jgi:hypothetical protein
MGLASLAAPLLYLVKYGLVISAVSLLWHQWTTYHRLSKVKGPFWAQFTNLWIFNVISEKKTNIRFFEAAEKYGKITSSLSPFCLMLLFKLNYLWVIL